ncbi:MAG: hypothetical protein GYA16_07170, partial [Spirochaetes bacterium]|nr:hypothetical protein [Spirochaetota bacterium]
HILTFLITLLVAALFACSYENTATVTIDTGIRQQAQLSLFDRVLAFFSLAQPLQADPVPGTVYVYSIIVNVTANDMETITRDVPLDTGKITLEVPAGSQRTFEVVGYDDGGNRYYGGITTVDLSPGQQVNLNIEMGELNNKIDYWYYYTNDKYFDTEYSGDEDPTSGVVAFKIYESDDSLYTNERLIFIINQWTSIYDVDFWRVTVQVELKDIGPPPGGYKYYRCSIVNQYGEGEKVEITRY